MAARSRALNRTDATKLAKHYGGPWNTGIPYDTAGEDILNRIFDKYRSTPPANQTKVIHDILNELEQLPGVPNPGAAKDAVEAVRLVKKALISAGRTADEAEVTAAAFAGILTAAKQKVDGVFLLPGQRAVDPEGKNESVTELITSITAALNGIIPAWSAGANAQRAAAAGVAVPGAGGAAAAAAPAVAPAVAAVAAPGPPPGPNVPVAFIDAITAVATAARQAVTDAAAAAVGPAGAAAAAAAAEAGVRAAFAQIAAAAAAVPGGAAGPVVAIFDNALTAAANVAIAARRVPPSYTGGPPAAGFANSGLVRNAITAAADALAPAGAAGGVVAQLTAANAPLADLAGIAGTIANTYAAGAPINVDDIVVAYNDAACTGALGGAVLAFPAAGLPVPMRGGRRHRKTYRKAGRKTHRKAHRKAHRKTGRKANRKNRKTIRN